MDNNLEPFKDEYQKFLDWVEDTSLFYAIKNDPNGTEIIDAAGESISIKLNKSHPIEKASDLPKEILATFFINSPWYHEYKSIVPGTYLNLFKEMY